MILFYSILDSNNGKKIGSDVETAIDAHRSLAIRQDI